MSKRRFGTYLQKESKQDISHGHGDHVHRGSGLPPSSNRQISIFVTNFEPTLRPHQYVSDRVLVKTLEFLRNLNFKPEDSVNFDINGFIIFFSNKSSNGLSTYCTWINLYFRAPGGTKRKGHLLSYVDYKSYESPLSPPYYIVLSSEVPSKGGCSCC